MRQLTRTEAGTLSGLLSYGTYVFDLLNRTLCAGIMKNIVSGRWWVLD